MDVEIKRYWWIHWVEAGILWVFSLFVFTEWDSCPDNFVSFLCENYFENTKSLFPWDSLFCTERFKCAAFAISSWSNIPRFVDSDLSAFVRIWSGSSSQFRVYTKPKVCFHWLCFIWKVKVTFRFSSFISNESNILICHWSRHHTCVFGVPSAPATCRLLRYPGAFDLKSEVTTRGSDSLFLVGIYLTTVMTMTSISVIMAVMVINVYNRSNKARKPPRWLKVLVLKWICRLLRMSHDMERLANSIKLVRIAWGGSSSKSPSQPFLVCSEKDMPLWCGLLSQWTHF